jgi:hypothetical protein
MYELREYLNAINYDKKPLLNSDDPVWEKKYMPFIINRCLSMHMDTIFAANEMNSRPFLSKKLQFDFLINIIRKRKRYGEKRISTKLANMEYVKEFFGYSNTKAKDALNILTKEQIEQIKKTLYKGGRK